MRGLERDIQNLIEDLRVVALIEKAAHIKIRLEGPDGKTTVFCPSTPSDSRTMKNLRAELKRAARKVGQH